MTALEAVPAIAALGAVLLVAPAVPGVATRTKSFFTGRRGAPVLQGYRDIARLLRKGRVYSDVSGWIFRAGPIVLLASLFVAALFLPLDGSTAPLHFAGDLVAFAGALGLARFVLVLSGLDTGSSFEGMGASRDVTIAAFAEPVLFLCFAALVLATGDLSLSGALGLALTAAWPHEAAPVVLVALALFVLVLAENARVPVDDPATHLELTMIHEVIVLDHSGPDLAFIVYGGALKLTLFAALVVCLLAPRSALPGWAALAILVGGIGVVAVLVGVVESVMARVRLVRVPQLIVAAGALALFGIILLLR